MNDLQQSNPIRIKLSLPLEIMTQLFVVGHEIKYRQRKGKKYRRAFFFFYKDKEDNSFATHSLTCHGLVRIFFIPSFIFFSFHVRNLANNKVLCSYMRKKGRKENPLLYDIKTKISQTTYSSVILFSQGAEYLLSSC